MKNITVFIPNETYHEARVWAAEHKTSISKVVAYLLQVLPSHPRAAKQFPAKNSPESNNKTSE